jgi:hypothetical protein
MSLHALRIYSLLMTILTGQSPDSPQLFGIVRTILSTDKIQVIVGPGLESLSIHEATILPVAVALNIWASRLRN